MTARGEYTCYTVALCQIFYLEEDSDSVREKHLANVLKKLGFTTG
jgi:hypothetical protein